MPFSNHQELEVTWEDLRGDDTPEPKAALPSKAKAAAANVHNRRLVAARLRQQPRSHFRGTPTVKGKELREAWKTENDVVHILCDQIAPAFKSRNGGYTRILRLGQRQGDSGQLAILEWVDFTPAAGEPAPAAPSA